MLRHELYASLQANHIEHEKLRADQILQDMEKTEALRQQRMRNDNEHQRNLIQNEADRMQNLYDYEECVLWERDTDPQSRDYKKYTIRHESGKRKELKEIAKAEHGADCFSSHKFRIFSKSTSVLRPTIDVEKQREAADFAFAQQVHARRHA